MVRYSSSRSEYAYNHLASQNMNKVVSEDRALSDSMVEDKDEDEERDHEVLAQPLLVQQ